MKTQTPQTKKYVELLEYATQLVDILLKENVKILSNPEAILYIMCGHFAAVLDFSKNKVYPSIETMFLEHVRPFAKEIQMETFSLSTFKIGALMAEILKQRGQKVKLCIIANDIMGIINIREHECNAVEKKSSKDYKSELLRDFFSDKKLPQVYLDVMSQHGLTLEDVASNKYEKTEIYCFRENALLEKFRSLVRRNKEVFDGKIEYDNSDVRNIKVDENLLSNSDADESLYEVSLPHFPQSNIEICAFRNDKYATTVKTGGNKCSLEIASLALKLFGGGGILDECTRMLETYQPFSLVGKIKVPKPPGVLFLMVPGACDFAVNRGAQLYMQLLQSPHAQVQVSYIEFWSNPENKITLL